MFVRVISYDKDEQMHNCLYECKRVHSHPGETKDGDGEATEVKFIMEDPDISILVEKKGCRVYIMNNDGKTIDSYIW